MSWTKDQAAGAAPHTRGSLGEARCEDETGTPRSEGKYQPPQTPDASRAHTGTITIWQHLLKGRPCSRNVVGDRNKVRDILQHVPPAAADVLSHITGHVTLGLRDFGEGQVGNQPRKLDI